MRAFATLGMNILNEILEDIDVEVALAYDLMNSTEHSIETCVLLGVEEETSACLRELHQLYILERDDVIGRISEQARLGRTAAADAERNQQEFINGNRNFVTTSSQKTRQDLTTCVQDLSQGNGSGNIQQN